jgi:hypothetical protein
MIENCKFIELNKLKDPRGCLAFIESTRHIPFDIKRIYYLYDIPSDAERGSHAHKALHQVIIAISGSFEIHLDDGVHKKSFYMNNPAIGLYICPMIWREIKSFSSNSVCLVLASEFYDEQDYYRDYDCFVNNANKGLSL